MAKPSLERLPLHELFKRAEHEARELGEHLEQDFLPKSEALLKLLRSAPDSPIDLVLPDQRIHEEVGRMLASETYTTRLTEDLFKLYAAIDRAVRSLVPRD